jgi:4-hydroxythreonine-4-phosphate dehydrogenase
MSVKMRGAVAISALYGFENLYQTNKSLQNGSEPFCVVTLPIDKYACSRAGFSFTGHTEYFGALWDGDPLMTLAYRDVRVALATTHVPLAQVTKELTKEKLVEKLKSMQSALIRQLGIQRPQILVCGINPHSGDRGAIGTEELETLCPALDVMRAEDKADFIGPVSGDTAFYMYHKLGCDGMQAMYHDQGLAPLKAVYFDSAINMTLGLKHFRMSPDHGPAQDIFGEDAASESSLEECFRTASIFLSHHIPENKKQKPKRLPTGSPGFIAGSTGLASGLQEGMRGKVIPFRIPKKSAGIPTKDA